ncbi:MAG: hypothetical protein FWF38_05250 [Spirochaetaceae bacterium]|nr:hypothetical protein [Spirochaetaceae bacterium]
MEKIKLSSTRTNRFFAVLFLFLLLLVIFSCTVEERKFYINIDGSGRTENISMKKEEQPAKNLVLYNLKKAYKVNSNNPLFFKAEIENSEGPYIFTIHTSVWAKEIEFIAVDKKTTIYFTVPGKDEPCEIKAFSIRLSENYDNYFWGNLAIPLLKEIRLIDKSDFVEGYIITHDSVSQSENFKNVISDNKNSFVFDLDGFFDNQALSNIIIEIDEKPLNEIEEPNINFYTGGIKNSIKAFPVKGRINITSIDLSEIIPEFLPGKRKTNTVVLINSSDNANIFKKISLIRDKVDTSPLIALEADFGTIINYQIEKWRQEKFEIFSWSIFPEFLVIDTHDYKFQNSMFKRLAFFVEKPESAGKLLTDAQMSGLHGWNAHDYKAEDLCNFFNLAQKTGFSLSDEEELLKIILQENKIIKKENSQFLPLRGGILSISRETIPSLRRVFVMHEGYHGVFFASGEFRKKSNEIWVKTSSDIKLFWQIFLAHRNYDIKNNYLLVNEFMAYHLQQNPTNGQAYFFNYSIPLLRERYPSRKDFFNNLKENYKEEFFSISTEFENTLFSITGLPAGNLIFISK